MKKEIDQPSTLLTIQDVVTYLEALINERGKRSDEAVAAAIVGLETNDRLEDWCKREPDIDAIVSASWDLERSNGSPAELARTWQDIGLRVERLVQRYVAYKGE